MNRGTKLFQNTIIISIGKICTSLVTFLLLPLYTGILSTEEYGTVDLLTTLMSLLLPIVTFQIEKGVFRELLEVRNDSGKQSKIISTGFLTVLLQILIFAILCFIIFPFTHNDYKYFLMLNVILYILVSLLQQISRGLDHMKIYSIGSFISAFFTIIFNIIFLLVLKMRVNGMLLGTFMGFLISFLYMFFSLRLHKYLTWKLYKKNILKQLVKYSLPLVPNSLSWWIFSSSDRVIVSSILGVDMNGILAASLKFSSIMTTLYNIFDTSWIESISSNINDEDIDVYFNKILNIVLNLFLSLGLGLISFMPMIYPLMVNSNYIAGYGLIPITIISSIFNILQGMVAVVYAAKKNTKSISRTSILSAIINIVLHLILIPFIGLYAAVVSTLVALVIMCIYRIYDVNKHYFRIIIDYKTICSSVVVLSIIVVLYYMNNFYSNILMMIISVVFALTINKNSFSYLKRFLVKKMIRKQ